MVVQKTGLAAVFETKEFQQGLKIYKQGLQDANSGTDKAAQSISGAGEAAGAAGGLFGTGLTGGMVAAGAAALAFVGIAKKVLDVIGNLISDTKELITSSVVLASRWQELSLGSQLMGARMGLTAQEVIDLNERMQDAGIRADVASKAIVTLSRLKIDPEFGLSLGRAAQDLAVFAQDGADSSQVLDDLLLGIQRLSPVILRTAGAFVDADTAYARYADTMGLVASELTQLEKRQAFANAVLESAADVAGAYELSMENAGKQMRSLTGREIPTLQAALGAPFQGAFLNVAKSLRGMVSSFTDAIQEGGRLYPIMVRLGAIAEIITDALRNLATKGTQAVIDFLSGIGNLFNDSIQSAYEWGFNLVVEFATGIVEAASSVLVEAINFLAGILTFWMQSFSPPKMLPDLVKWGVGAMTEYLKGFTQADFGILRSIQSPLKSAFDLMVKTGQKTRLEVAEIFLGLNEDIAKALAGDEGIGEGLLSRISRQAGQFGGEIAKLIKGQFELAKATDDVADAQERVNKAMQQQQESEQAVRDLTDEYNRLLRAGASDEVLKNQLAQINAAEDQAMLSAEQRAAAEDDLVEKEDTLALLEEQVKLQGELVKQLLELAKAAIVPAQAAPAPGAGGAGGLPEGLEGVGAGFEIDQDAFIDKIRDAVTAAKAELLKQWGETWDAVKELFREKFGPAIEEVLLAWENFVTVASEFYNTYLQPIWDFIQDDVIPLLEALWDVITAIADLILLSWVIAWGTVWDVMKDVWNWLKGEFKPFLDILLEVLDSLGISTDGWTATIDSLKQSIKLVIERLQTFHKWLVDIADQIRDMPIYKAITGDSPIPMVEDLKQVNDQLRLYRQNLAGVRSDITGLNAVSASSVFSPQMSSQSVVSPAQTRILNMNQTNHIQSPMDLATFRVMFNQVVREQFSGV